MNRRGPGVRRIGLILLVIALGCVAPLRSQTVAQGASGVGLGASQAYLNSSEDLERAGRVECVDQSYRAAVAAYACLLRGDREALPTYNRALTRCLRQARAHGRLDPRSRLLVKSPAGMVAVPVLHRQFVWSPEDFNHLVDPAELKSDPGLERPHAQAGIGAPQVVVRERRNTPQDAFFARHQPFSATAVLHADVSAWFSAGAKRLPADRLELLDPKRVDRVMLGNAWWPMASDLDAMVSMLRELQGGDRYRFASLLRPDSTLQVANLYMFEPYQPGKIPLVLIHGLWSSPTTWSDMLGDLDSDPAILDRYQIWTFTYPTGVGILRNATILRDALDRVVPTLDPSGQDPALREIVLAGHSMGGLLAKLQVTSSQRILWDAYATAPFEQVKTDPKTRAFLARQVFFEPQPYVRRVIFLATPHRGSNTANNLGGRIGSSLIRLPDDGRAMYNQLRADNPGLFADWARRKQPTSIDLLEDDHPLLMAMLQLPRAQGVPWHSVVGTAKKNHLTGELGDGVVPVHSAVIGGVESEIYVEATHGGIHHHPASVAEVKRILAEHHVQLTSGLTRAGAAATDPEVKAAVSR